MSIAVCICTMRRPSELRSALESLSACEPAPDELVVSDDSPADDARSEDVCRSFPQVVYQRGPRQGLAANRNACVRVCRSQWIHFIDDDVVVHPLFYGDFGDVLPTLPSDSIVTGWEKMFQKDDPTPRVVRPPRHGFWSHMTPAASTDFNCVVINATLFPRSLFDRVRFDEFFKYGCEESDISRHAVHVGYKLMFSPKLWVEHRPSSVNRDAYFGSLIASKVYSGLKRQWTYEGSGLGTLAFLGVAVPRLLLHTLKRHGLRLFLDGSGHACRGARQFVRAAISNTPKGLAAPTTVTAFGETPNPT